MAQTSLQSTQTKVPVIGISAPAVTGNAETIVNAIGKFANNSVRAAAIDAATTGFVLAYNEPRCGGTVSGSSLDINGALATAGARAGAAEVSKTVLKSVPVVGNLLGGLASLVSLPFAHHKQAVAKEQNTLCVLAPKINTFLHQIDELLLTGQIDGQTAIGAMENFYENWTEAAKPIWKGTVGTTNCNAACDYALYMRAAIEMRKLRIAAGAVLDARGSNDVNTYAPALPFVPGSSGGLVPAVAGWNTRARMTAAPLQQASVFSLAGFTAGSQSKLAIAVILLLVFGVGVVVNLTIARRATK